jgi:hypothetical protein
MAGSVQTKGLRILTKCVPYCVLHMLRCTGVLCATGGERYSQPGFFFEAFLEAIAEEGRRAQWQRQMRKAEVRERDS